MTSFNMAIAMQDFIIYILQIYGTEAQMEHIDLPVIMQP